MIQNVVTSIILYSGTAVDLLIILMLFFAKRKSRKDIKTAPQDFYTAYSCEAVIMLYDGCLPMPGIIHLPEKAA